MKTTLLFSFDLRTVCNRRGLAGPESPLPLACLQDPSMKEIQKSIKAMRFRTVMQPSVLVLARLHSFHIDLEQRCIDYSLTHLIEALVHQFDQRRRINIGVHFHRPVALDYFHAEVQRVLKDASKNK